MDAQMLVDRLELPQKYPGSLGDQIPQFYVPALVPDRYLPGIQGRVANASQIERDIQATDRDAENEATFRNLFSTILSEMGNNMDGFIDTKGNLNKAKTAMADCEAKRRDMANYVQATRNASKVFDQGVQNYQKEKNSEFDLLMLRIGGEMVVSVIVALSTCGAGAPLMAGKLAEAQKVITGGLSLWAKVKKALLKISETAGKLLPKLQKAYSNQSVYNKKVLILDNTTFKSIDKAQQAAAQVLKEEAERITASTMPASCMVTIDYLDILADWDQFDVEVDSMFNELQRELKEDSIAGMPEYRLALKNQAIRGRTVVMAMRNMQEAMQFYHRQEAERVARESRTKQLHSLASKVKAESQGSIARHVLRWSLIEESINARRTLFVRVHQCLLSIIYSANSACAVEMLLKKRPIKADNTADQFTHFIEDLEDLRTQVKSKENSFGDPVTVSTSNPKFMGPIFTRDWKECLVQYNCLYFSIPHNAIGRTKDWTRVRITELSAKFTGLQFNPDRPVEWDWELGPQFVDKDGDESPIQYYMPVQTLHQTSGKGEWVDKSNDFPDPTLFCNGRIVFTQSPEDMVSGMEDEGAASLDSRPISNDILGIDFTGVTEVTLSFKCVGRRVTVRAGEAN
jgi:hypothetical protein